MNEEQQRLRYPLLAPEGIAALSAVEHHLNAESGLEPSLLELVRLRSSQLNQCHYCIALHASELLRHNEPTSRVDAVAVWRQGDAFTERERAALRWAEVITNIQLDHAPADEFDAARRHFTDRELVELTLAIASINAWNRMAIAFRPQWRSHAPAAPPEQAEPEQSCTPSATEGA